MKSVPKLIRRFVGILLLSSILIVIINVIAFVALMASKIPDENTSPYSIAKETGTAVKSDRQRKLYAVRRYICKISGK